MTRKFHPDGICAVYEKIGPTHYDVDTPETPPLCDRCAYAQKRWDAWQAYLRCPGLGYPYMDQPPKSPPLPLRR